MKRPDTAVNTGSKDFDQTRFKPKGENETPDKPVGIDLGAWLGDFIEGLFERGISPSWLMFVAFVGAGICLAISVYGYSRIFVPGISQAVPGFLGYLAGWGLSIVGAVGTQTLEIFPKLPEYMPGLADRLAVKLKLNPTIQPKEDSNSPSLLPKANQWAKNAHEELFDSMVAGRWGAYGFETFGALWAFRLVVAGVLNVPGLVAAAVAVAGFEQCVKFGAWMRTLRLNRHESRKYRETKKELRSKAAQSLKA